MWDTQTGACKQTLKGHGGSVHSVAFSGDGQHVVSGSSDSTIKIWDTQTGACKQTLKGHGGSVYSVAFSSDGLHVVSGSSDRTIKIWDTQAGSCVWTLKVGGVINVRAFDTSNESKVRVFTDQGWMNLGTGKAILGSSRLLEDENENEKEDTTQRRGNENTVANGQRYGLSADRRWIHRHDQNILWLPPDFRPSRSAVWQPSDQASTSRSYVALGCPSGRVVVLGLSECGLTPLLSSYFSIKYQS